MWLRQRFVLCSLLLLAFTAAASPDPHLSLWGHLVPGGMVRGTVAPKWQLFLDEKPVVVNRHGRFAFGFGRDQTGAHWLDAKHPSGTHFRFKLIVNKRQFAIQRIDGLPPQQVTPTAPEILRRIRAEAKRVHEARTIVSQSEGFWQQFIRPAEGKISGVYGSQRILNGEPKRPHFGEDIAAPVGQPVKACADGIVRLAASDLYFSGGTIIIDHGAGISSSYLHLSEVLVKVGQKVRQGEQIGRVGQTGRATGPHLDWRLNWFDVRLDPRLAVAPDWPPIQPVEVIHVQ
ncbi:MAG: M23 family metallopeptidase [Gammaproteobacteria bacterium]|nr:MAG: M23 family metallopeptidase [Gammaproteobacteria bacterium]